MLSLNDYSLGEKLMAMMLIPLLLALLIMIAGVLLHKYDNDYSALSRQTLMLAQVIASRSTGALEFHDQPTAHENLSVLKVARAIDYAALLLPMGQVFAKYQRHTPHDGRSHFLLDRLLKDSIQLSLPVTLENQTIGEMRIEASLYYVKQQLIDYLIMLLLITLMAILSALFSFRRLRTRVSKPISDLIEAMVSVSRHENYSIRVNHTAGGDIGVLIAGFNEMLKRIEIREQQLTHHQNTLQAEITKQSEALVQVTQQRIAWLETMANFLQHELKNTTIGVKTSLDLIERRSVQGREIGVYLQRARKSMRYMNELLYSASTASSLEAAIYQEQLLPLHLSELIAERCYDYQMLYQEAEFTLRCEPGLFIQGSALRIQQLLDNLVSNAIDHHQPGTVVEIILCRCDPNHTQLTISNYGSPLPADTSHLFELFFSMRPVEAGNENHLGLGLYVVRLIAESHQGQVFARDREEGTGAVFKIVLPLIQSASSPLK